MGELDYQMALMLQYKFQQEHKHKENTDSDLQLALDLHEQFKQEEEVQRPKNNLVYKDGKPNNSKCLVDPSWEVIDPTPDVHVLFITFNKRFFWDKLGSVTVSWSKRMTSCAGICAYQGRGGMCSITLSEPLLKLRPRKDLVETLLHEMIHAYLFVTHNNRDRDGHGPEFHKHMYRINAEAGTNISVYHDFHDEVRLYQQHWWRCDGPCQHQKPYFGTVRRATNRAPGPNDRWWEEHKRNCGGNFIKVKSPETANKPSKSKKAADKTNSAPSKTDIRNFIPKKPQNAEDSASKLTNKIHTITSNSGNQPVSNVIPSKTGNIFGFTNLGTSGSKKPPASGVKGAVKNAGSSTFVVTNKKTGNSTKTNETSSNILSKTPVKVEVFNGSGKPLGKVSNPSTSKDDYSVVRDHWLKKFEGRQTNTGIKRPLVSSTPKKEAKIAKTDNSSNIPKKDDLVECPVCQELVKDEDLNLHLDSCLENPQSNKKECLLCGLSVPSDQFDKHFKDCSAKSFDDDAVLIDSPKKDSESCPACKMSLSKANYASHVQSCLDKMFDGFNKIFGSDSSETSCLVCNKKIPKSEVDSHLDECNGMSNIFDTTNVFVEDDAEEAKDGKGKHDISYNCPFCLQLVDESVMEDHLEKCLKCEEKEKKDLVSSLCEADSDFEDC